MMERIHVAGPWITEKEIGYVMDAAMNAWYEKASVYHERFERAFAAYLGRRFAVALPSCTSAIHLSLLALGVGDGDEVIVPDITWIGSSAAIAYVGATPVFADIDPKSWCLAAESVKERITSRTKAIIPVDLYGNLPEMDALLAIAREHDLHVIEDAAQAIGAEYQGRKAGTFGDTGVFSFHGSKTLTTGEGGMLVTDREDLYNRVLTLRDHGRIPGKKLFWNGEVAYKYKMSSLQAALGLAQLERIGELLERKCQIFQWYREELKDLEGVTLNHPLPGVKSSYWMTTAILSENFGLLKEDFIALFSEHGIDCRPLFYPLSSLPAYEDAPQAREARLQNRIAYQLTPYGINLPSALNLSRRDVGFVSGVLKEIIGSRQIPTKREGGKETVRDSNG
jgi:perosamine synthetase